MISTSLKTPHWPNACGGKLPLKCCLTSFRGGFYSTDASIYQIKPLGVVVPKNDEDVLATISIANDTGVSVTMRGGGTSQCGQTVGEGIIVDVSKHLHRLISVDVRKTRRTVVQPGIVLDQLNTLNSSHT